jgi:hypothetical protein
MIRSPYLVAQALHSLWRRAVLSLLTLWGGRGLDYYDKTPHVCFKAEFASAASAGNELSRILESRLQARFDSVRRIRILVLGSAARCAAGRTRIVCGDFWSKQI